MSLAPQSAAPTPSSATPNGDRPVPPLVDMRGIEKRFDQVRALRGVDFSLHAGEVHALVGENGAGKSTLIKALAGAHTPDAGTIAIAGEQRSIASTNQARRLGLSFVFQELATVPHFTVAEYMNLGQPYGRRAGLLVDWSELRERAQGVAERIGFDFPVTARMHTLTVAQQRLAEIGQGLMHGSRVLVLDEPTATLTEREVERLFDVIRQLRADGVGIVYASHRLEEIFALADRVTVFRDGTRVATHAIDDCTREQLVREIVGTDLVPRVPRPAGSGEPVLEVEGLTNARIRDISLTLRAGEILGLAGLVGSGRSEIARAIYGADPLERGTIRLHGKPVRISSPRRALDLGIGLMSEERKTQGLLLSMSIRENITIGSLRQYRRRSGLLSKRRERESAGRHAERLRLRMGGLEAPVTSLSGGNQQKVILSRLLDSDVDVLLLDEPTKGVDIGAKQEMFRLIQELAARGTAVLFISSDLEEVGELCDRALVLREGEIVGYLEDDRLTKASILELSYGRRST